MAHQSHYSAGTLLERLLLVSAVGAVTVAVGPDLAAASSAAHAPQPPKPYPWGYGYGADQPGHGSTDDDGGSGGTSGAPVSSGGGEGGYTGPGSLPICGSWRFGIQVCDPIDLPADPADGSSTAGVSPAQLAQEAWDRLPIPEPEVETAPPRGSDGLVGLPQWFWVANWDRQQGRVEAGGVWAEVAARPTSLMVSPGSGLPLVTCEGPGRPYDRSRPARGQRSACSYTYVRSSAGMAKSAYRVTVTVTWGGTWRGSGGTGGALPALSRSTSFLVRVAEGQAVAGG